MGEEAYDVTLPPIDEYVT